MKKRIISMLVIAFMLVALVPINVLASDVSTENVPDETRVTIEQGLLDVPAEYQGQISYPIDAKRILDDGTNFFGSPTGGWYLLDANISDNENISSSLQEYNLLLKGGSVGGNDGSWYWDHVNLWGMIDSQNNVSFSDVWIDGTGFSINSGRMTFENAVINCLWQVNGGEVTLDANCVGTNTLRIRDGQLHCSQLGRDDLEWSGDIVMDGGYITIEQVNGFGGKFYASDNATVLVSTSANDTRFDNIKNGIVFKGNEGIVKGNVTLLEDYQVMGGKKLVVPKDSVLTIGDHVTLTNHGNIHVEGTLDSSRVGANIVGNPVEMPKPPAPITPDLEPILPPLEPPVNPPVNPPVELPVEPSLPEPKDPIYLVPNVAVAPLYGIGANMGMTNAQQAMAKDVLKYTVEKMAKKDEQEQSHLEQDIVECLENGKQLTVKIQSEKLRDKYVPDDRKVIENMQSQLGEIFDDISWQLVDVFDIKAIADENGNALGEINRLEQRIPFTVMLAQDCGDIYTKTSVDESKKKYCASYGIVKFKDGKIEILSPDDFYGDELSKAITFNTDDMATYGVYWYDRKTPKLSVTDVKVSGIKAYAGNDRLKVAFNKMAGADSYQVYIRNVRTNKKWKVYNLSKNSLTLTRFDGKAWSRNGKYQIKVVAVFNTNSYIPIEPMGGEYIKDGYIVRKTKASYVKTVYGSKIMKKF